MLNRRKPHVTKAVADVVVGVAEGGGDNNTRLRRRGGGEVRQRSVTIFLIIPLLRLSFIFPPSPYSQADINCRLAERQGGQDQGR